MGANSSSLGRICNIHNNRSGGDTINTNNLPPLLFHQTHGENVRLSHAGATARRAESFCKGIAFSNRPIKVNERIYLRFAEISMSWSGVVRFGFTSVDPSSLRGSLPKYACPDFTNKPGYWAKALAERYAERDAVLFYYVTQTGDVHYGINGEEKGIFFNGVDTRSPLWSLIDIYGNTIALEFLDVRIHLNNQPRHTVSSIQRVSIPNVATDSEELLIIHNAGQRFEQLRFHSSHGRNIQISDDFTISTRIDTEFSQGYVFTQTPLRPQHRLVIQVLQTDCMYVGSLAFGLTACNPASITANDLPEDSNLLLDRPEYWVVNKDVANTPQRGDELGFMISAAGEVLFYKNNLLPVTIMHVDQTLPLWAFFDVFANTVKIKMLGCTRDDMRAHQIDPLIHRGSELQVILPPASSSNNRELERLTSNESFVGGLDGIDDNSNNECTICYERAVDSVLYTCGHMCMCYDCAKQLWKKTGGGQCPICRNDIKDVIRTYRS